MQLKSIEPALQCTIFVHSNKLFCHEDDMSLLLSAIAAVNLAQAPVELTPVRVSDSNIRGAVRALRQDEWRNALHFTEEALSGGSRTSVRAAAYANACIAHFHLGELDAALAACTEATTLAPSNEVMAANLTAVQAAQ